MSAIPENYNEYELACNEDIFSRKYPDRRWRQVQWHIQTQSTPETRLSIRDPRVRQALQAELLRRNPKSNRSSSDTVNTDIFAALELGQSDPVQADLIRAYLLAGQTTSQVATLVGLRDDVIDWFERLFFDVGGQLEAYDWVSAHIIEPADRAMDEIETGSPEFVRARDRAVLLNAAYTCGMEILRRIVSSAVELALSSNVSPLNNSPYAQILSWLSTTEVSLPTYVQILERFEKLMINSTTFSDSELDRRMERLCKFIERHSIKHAGRTKQTRRVRKTNRKLDGADSDFLSQWLDKLIATVPGETTVNSRAQDGT